jgi:hypothetical protein
MQKMANLSLKLTVNSFAVCPQLILIVGFKKENPLTYTLVYHIMCINWR